MPRAHLFRSVEAVPTAATAIPKVTVCEAGTQTPIAATMYTGIIGTATLSNPLSVTNGVVDFYLEQPQDVCLIVDYGSATLIVDYQGVFPTVTSLIEMITGVSPINLSNYALLTDLSTAIAGVNGASVDSATSGARTLHAGTDTPRIVFTGALVASRVITLASTTGTPSFDLSFFNVTFGGFTISVTDGVFTHVFNSATYVKYIYITGWKRAL